MFLGSSGTFLSFGFSLLYLFNCFLLGVSFGRSWSGCLLPTTSFGWNNFYSFGRFFDRSFSLRLGLWSSASLFFSFSYRRCGKRRFSLVIR
jgi:hypothetical protein